MNAVEIANIVVLNEDLYATPRFEVASLSVGAICIDTNI